MGSLLVFCAFLLGKTRWPLPAVLSLGVICLWRSSAPALVVPVFQKLSDSWPCPLVFSTRAWGSLSPLRPSPSSASLLRILSQAGGFLASGAFGHSPCTNGGRDATLSTSVLGLTFRNTLTVQPITDGEV